MIRCNNKNLSNLLQNTARVVVAISLILILCSVLLETTLTAHHLRDQAVRQSHVISQQIALEIRKTSLNLREVAEDISKRHPVGDPTALLTHYAETFASQNIALSRIRLGNLLLTDTDHRIIASLKPMHKNTALTLADRDYLHKAFENPLIPIVGAPVIGKISGALSLPIGVRLAPNATVGSTLVAGIDIISLESQILTTNYSEALNSIDFDDAAAPVQMPSISTDNISLLKLFRTIYFDSTTSITFDQKITDYPVRIFLHYDKAAITHPLWSKLTVSTLLLLLCMMAILGLLFIIDLNVARPIKSLLSTINSIDSNYSSLLQAYHIPRIGVAHESDVANINNALEVLQYLLNKENLLRPVDREMVSTLIHHLEESQEAAYKLL
jgi:hypothetical protein